MKNKLEKFLNDLASVIGLDAEREEDTAPSITKERKHQILLNRIKEIRTDSNFVPNYDKPKVHTDIVILFKTNPIVEDFEPINSNTKTTQKRPAEFENNIEKWILLIQSEAKEFDNKRRLQEEEMQKLIEENARNTQKFMNKFLTVN